MFRISASFFSAEEEMNSESQLKPTIYTSRLLDLLPGPKHKVTIVLRKVRRLLPTSVASDPGADEQ